MTRRTAIAVGFAGLAGALAYLHDPSWLSAMDSGFSAGDDDPTIGPYRRMKPHAWFFIPAGVTTIDIPMRLVLTNDEPHPVRVRVTVDDRRAADVALETTAWTTVSVPCGEPAGVWRRHKRVDLYVNRAWADGLTGLQVGRARYATAPGR